MDAPPVNEDCRPFVEVAGYLEAMQLNAPRIVEADVERGFLLLTDLGTRQYLDELTAYPEAAPALYADAINALQTLHERGRRFQSRLPPYDVALLDFELSLFHDWLCGTHVGLHFDAASEMRWRDTCALLIRNALDQPRVFVHRDYHSRNLMVTKDNNPGMLDFQDAVEGPLSYDLVSLLKDCYVRWPAEQVEAWALEFYAGLSDEMRARVGRASFLRHFELTGVQRHLKAAGIFARLNHRDGKAAYLQDIPRTLAYITELKSRYEELEFVIALIEDRVLPAFGAAR